LRALQTTIESDDDHEDDDVRGMKKWPIFIKKVGGVSASNV